MSPAERLRAIAKRTALDGIAEELVAISQELESAAKICDGFAAPELAAALRGQRPAAQEVDGPISASLGDIVALWDQHAPSEYMTAIHMQAKRALAGQQPMSPDMARWCAYVGGMVAHWVKSEPDALARLGDDAFEAAIAGIIERRLWAMPKPAPQQATPERHLTVTTNQQGEAVMVSWQDDEHRILDVVWERKPATPEPVGKPVAKFDENKGRPVMLDDAPMLAHGDLLYPRPAPGVPEVAREALERIASWNEHPAMLGVDYGSNGVRDYYRKIASDALVAAQAKAAHKSRMAQKRKK